MTGVKLIKDVDWLLEELVNKNFENREIENLHPLAWLCYICNKKWRESPKYRFFRGQKGCKNCNKLEEKQGRTCIEPGCLIKATFGVDSPIYCKAHSKVNMKNLFFVKCLEEGCNYGRKSKNRPYCLQHTKEEIYISGKCVNPECNLYAAYSPPGGKRRRCCKHKIEGDINLAGVHCIEKDCNRSAIYNST